MGGEAYVEAGVAERQIEHDHIQVLFGVHIYAADAQLGEPTKHFQHDIISGGGLAAHGFEKGTRGREVRLIQMKSAGQGLPLAERRTTRAGPRVMMTRRARAGSGRLVTGRTGRQHGQGDQIGSEVRFGEEGQFVGNGTTKPTKGPTPEFRRTRAPAGPGLPIPQMGPVRMATLKIYKKCFRRWSIPPGSRGVPGLRDRRSERRQGAARRAGLKAGHQQLLAVKLVERQCLSVSSLYLGQPRGIANLAFVSDRLSY